MNTHTRNDRGLTTLEWLLIVAAVAGLAALAVVLVQNVVDDTAEQIAGNNARITAAQVAAKAITDSTDTDEQRRAACRRLEITYSGAFAEDPKRAAFWSDPKTNVTTDGKCFVISEAAKDALEAASNANTSLETCKSGIKSANGGADLTAVQLGGRTIAWTPKLPRSVT